MPGVSILYVRAVYQVMRDVTVERQPRVSVCVCVCVCVLRTACVCLLRLEDDLPESSRVVEAAPNMFVCLCLTLSYYLNVFFCFQFVTHKICVFS